MYQASLEAQVDRKEQNAQLQEYTVINGCSDDYMHVQSNLQEYQDNAAEFLEETPKLIIGVVSITAFQILYMCCL
jgi:hypothetical protein